MLSKSVLDSQYRLIHFLSNQRFIPYTLKILLVWLEYSNATENSAVTGCWKLLHPTFQMTHVFSKLYLQFFQVKILEAEEQLSSYRFCCKSVFSASKFTRVSFHRCLPRNLESKVGSKWLKEYIVYFVWTRSVSAKKLNCQYGRKNQFCLLSEHLWKSNFQKQSKRTNSVVCILSFGSIWRCFEATRRCF